MLLFLLSFCLIPVCICQIDPAEEDYVLNMDSPIYVCPDEVSQAFVDASDIEVHRHNESATYLSGILKLLKGFDRQTMLEILVEKELSGRHELITSIEMCDLCQELEDPESLYNNYLKYFGFPDECPIEPNEYTVDHFVLESKELPVNSATVGRYQATMNFYDHADPLCKGDKDFIACLKLDFVVEPV